MASAGDVVVTLEGVSLGYDGRAVLRDVSFRVARGDYIGLFGPNGAGKTTLFRGLLGVLAPLRGRIAWAGGRPVLGYVPQRDHIDPIWPLSTAEVVQLGLRETRGPRPTLDARRRVHDCLERVGMAAHARRPFAALSGGQRQRVLIARAMACEPAALLLDEPTAGVEQATERAVLEVLHRLNRQGMTILLVDHHLQLVTQHVRRVVWVEESAIHEYTAEAFRAQGLAPAGD